MVSRSGKGWVSAGLRPAFFTLSMNFAEVPKNMAPSSCTKSNIRLPSGKNGEPSYSIRVASQASADTSQFHIIQPQVVN